MLGAGALALRARLDSPGVRLLIAGGVLFLVALIASAARCARLLGRRAARYGAGTAVMILLVLGIVVFANALSFRHSARWDLTENRRNSLSPQTIQLLRDAQDSGHRPSRSSAPTRRASAPPRTSSSSTPRYAGGKFTWRLEDPDKAPGLARRYGVETYGTVVLRADPTASPGSRRCWTPRRRSSPTGWSRSRARASASSTFSRGTARREIGNSDRGGFSQAKEPMEKANYEVKPLVLAREGKVPDDAALVIVPGPRNDLFPPELDALDAYIARGGKVFFMATPFQAEGLKKHLAKYGVMLDDDLVIEPNPIGQLFGIGPHVPIVNRYEPHPITRDLAGHHDPVPPDAFGRGREDAAQGGERPAPGFTSAAVMGRDRPVRVPERRGPARPGREGGRCPWPWSHRRCSGGSEAGRQARGDRREEARQGPDRCRRHRQLRRQPVPGAQGNRDFFLNIVTWLAEQEDMISIRPKDTRQNPVMLTSAQANIVFWLPLVVLPGAVLICGIIVVVRRRRLT